DRPSINFNSDFVRAKRFPMRLYGACEASIFTTVPGASGAVAAQYPSMSCVRRWNTTGSSSPAQSSIGDVGAQSRKSFSFQARRNAFAGLSGGKPVVVFG